MAQSKILLDTNSYLRLAKSIHPLLFVEFGSDLNCLYVLRELDEEYARSRRLQSKFGWVNEEIYLQNRGKHLTLAKSERQQVALAKEYLWDHVLQELPGPSPIDCLALAYGLVLSIPVVTDDGDMHKLASVFGIKVISSLQLMSLMLQCNHIEMRQVRQVVAYWSYEIDLPRNFAADYRATFGEEPPT